MISNISKDDQEALLNAFKQYLYAEDSSRNTTSAYLSDLAHFFAWYTQVEETFDIESNTPTDIRGYRESLQEQVPLCLQRRSIADWRRYAASLPGRQINMSFQHRQRTVFVMWKAPYKVRSRWVGQEHLRTLLAVRPAACRTGSCLSPSVVVR